MDSDYLKVGNNVIWHYHGALYEVERLEVHGKDY